MDVERVDPVTVKCEECGAEMSADSPALRVELAHDDEWVVYCVECWQRELGESGKPSTG